MGEAFWSHRTKTGRVVYDRKVNGFRFKDATRIQTALARTNDSQLFGEHLGTSLEMGLQDMFYMQKAGVGALSAGFLAIFKAYGQIEMWMRNDPEIASAAATWLLTNRDILDRLSSMGGIY